MPTITVLIPTYNRAHLIARAVESALSQTLAPTEVVVVDDGSTDDTRAVVEGLAGPIRYIYQENRGASAARNVGAGNAQGEWMAFLDSDDVWLPDHLANIHAAIEATAGGASIYFSDTLVDPDLTESPADWFMRPRQPLLIQTTVVRRNDFLAVGGMPTALPSRGDTHLFFKLALTGRACAVAGVGGIFTADDKSGSRLTSIYATRSRGYLDETIWLYEDLLASFTELSPEHRRELRRRLSGAYWARGKLDLIERSYFRGIGAVIRSIGLEPRVPAVRIWNVCARAFS
jgi:glycosyltransferase involved in cell wall biosynthesis